ncbi:hypothetical protein HED43_17895 [Citrobacter freundii]|nr:hypothetical protein [Citrobacter freundii]
MKKINIAFLFIILLAGTICFFAFPSEKNELTTLQIKAESGSPDAEYDLGKLYRQGQLVEKK